MQNPLFKLTALVGVMGAGALVVLQAQKHLALPQVASDAEQFTPLTAGGAGPAATSKGASTPAEKTPSAAPPRGEPPEVVTVPTPAADPFALLVQNQSPEKPRPESPPATDGEVRGPSASPKETLPPAQSEPEETSTGSIELVSSEEPVDPAFAAPPLKKFPSELQAPTLLTPPSAEPLFPDANAGEVRTAAGERAPASSEAAVTSEPILLTQAAGAPPPRERTRPAPPSAPGDAAGDPFAPGPTPAGSPATEDSSDLFLPYGQTEPPAATPPPNAGPAPDFLPPPIPGTEPQDPFSPGTSATTPPGSASTLPAEAPPPRQRNRDPVPMPPTTDEEPLFLPDSPARSERNANPPPTTDPAAAADLFLPQSEPSGTSPGNSADGERMVLPPGPLDFPANDSPPPQGPAEGPSAPPLRTREAPSRTPAPAAETPPFPTDLLPPPESERTPAPSTSPATTPEPTFFPEPDFGPPAGASLPRGAVPPPRDRAPRVAPEPSPALEPNLAPVPEAPPGREPSRTFIPDAPAPVPPETPPTPPRATELPAFPSVDELNGPLNTRAPSNTPVPAQVPTPVNAAPPGPAHLLGTGTVEGLTPAGRQQPELQIEKDAPPRAVLNQPLVYNIRVRNVGRTAAHQVIVEDSIPRGTRLVGTNPGATQDPRDQHLTWELGTLEPGAERLIRVQIIPIEPGEIGSVATVRFVGRIAARTVITAPKLQLEMTGPVETAVGDTPVYRYRITNVGDGDAAHVIIQCSLPPLFQHPAGSELENDLGTLRAGESREIDLTVAAVRAGRGVNTAALVVDGQEQARDSRDVVVLASRLSLERTGPERRFVNRPAHYTTQITNQSSQPLRNVTVVEQLPVGMELAAVPEHGRYDAARRMIVWTLPQLGPQESRQFRSALVTADPGTYASTVKVWDAAGNRAEATSQLQVAGFSSLKIDVAQTTQGGGEVAVGEQVALRMTVVNRGSAPASEIVTEFDIPPELEFVAARPNRFTLDAQGRKVRFEAIPSLEVNGEHVIDIVCVARSPGLPRVAASLWSKDQQPIRQEEAVVVFRDDP